MERNKLIEADFDDEETEESSEDLTKKKQVFNSAIATLETLTVIGRQDDMVCVDTQMSEMIKQRKRITLLKALLRGAIRLTPKSFDEKFRNSVFNIFPSIKSFVKGGNTTQRYSYDPYLDRKIDDMINKINETLNEQGFFVPPTGQSGFF